MSVAKTNSPLEQEIERRCCTLAEYLGWLSFKGFSRSGGADRIFFRGGKCFLVEFKTTKGKQRATQINEEKAMKENGTPYYLVRSIEEFRDILVEESK